MNQKIKSETKSESDNQKNTDKSASRILKNSFIVIGIIFVAFILYAIYETYAYKQIESFEDAGEIVGASYTTSFYLNTTAIQTTKGTFVGVGFMHAKKRNKVRIEKRGNGDQALCDVEGKVCIKLLGK